METAITIIHILRWPLTVYVTLSVLIDAVRLAHDRQHVHAMHLAMNIIANTILGVMVWGAWRAF